MRIRSKDSHASVVGIQFPSACPTPFSGAHCQFGAPGFPLRRVLPTSAAPSPSVATTGPNSIAPAPFSPAADSNLYLRRTKDRLLLSSEHRAAPASPPGYLELVATTPETTHLEVSGNSPASSDAIFPRRYRRCWPKASC